NLIDTSTNYTDGGSERLVGAAVRDLVRRGRLRREEVVVVSKIGYVQGSNLTLAQTREAAGQPFPEMVKYMEGCWHCIHPDFLDDQLGRSLDRLGLERLDLCLLHNPEYFFADAKRRHAGSLTALRDEFYRRLREAFGFFERQVAAGRLCWYGVSSNTAAASAADPEATSLRRMLRAAREAGGPEPHFRVLQLPMNLFEANAVFERGTNGAEAQETVLELAVRERIGVLVNRPLNAIVGDRMLRLADVQVEAPEVALEAQLAVVAALEAEYRRAIAAALHVSPGSTPPAEFFRWAEQLRGLPARLQSLDHWQQIEGRTIGPTVTQVVRALDAGLQGPLADQWRAWRDRYLPELRRLLGALRHLAAKRAQTQSRAVAAAVDPRLPEARRGESLSRKALWVLASTPAVSVVLNGMRRKAYVDDALGILGWPPLTPVLPVYEAVRGLDRPRSERTMGST
ncbi:MAG: aldo/keto reductase, partial [Candidatus Rokuibacteriota bacterium]